MIAALLACAGAPTPLAEGLEGLEIEADDGSVGLTLASATLDDPPTAGRGVQAAGQVSGEPPIEISGDRSAWSLPDGIVTFEGGVRVVRGGLVLTADRVVVQMAGADVLTAEADGAVRAEDAGRVATGAHATLDRAAATVVLTGQPRLVDGGRTLVGERITFHLDAERVECDRCTLSIAR